MIFGQILGDSMKPSTINTIERNFPDHWVLIEVTETKDGAPLKGILLKASKNRQEVIEEMGKHRDTRLFFFFSGVPVPPDTAFAL
jgi:hypothetical protein